MITVGIGPMQTMLVEPPERKREPAGAIDAKFSAPFCTASALVNDGVNLDSFGAKELRDPAVLALAAKVRYQQPPGAEHWRGDAGTLAIDLRDGRCFDAALDRARGTPDHALSDAQLIDKFADCAVRAARPLSDGDARDLAVKILTLEECGDVGEMFQI